MVSHRPKRTWQLAMISLAIASLTLLAPEMQQAGAKVRWATPAAVAQGVRLEMVAPRVYQRLPDLPRENQYIDVKTGQPAEDNTLITRLIRYHIYVKGRPPQYRLDWKLTLADYLDANEVMQESVYPGYNTLRQNPMTGDRAVIQRLTRKQREVLVQSLADAFSPNSRNSTSQFPATSESSPRPTLQPRPQPGAADLLK